MKIEKNKTYRFKVIPELNGYTRLSQQMKGKEIILFSYNPKIDSHLRFISSVSPMLTEVELIGKVFSCGLDFRDFYYISLYNNSIIWEF